MVKDVLWMMEEVDLCAGEKALQANYDAGGEDGKDCKV